MFAGSQSEPDRTLAAERNETQQFTQDDQDLSSDFTGPRTCCVACAAAYSFHASVWTYTRRRTRLISVYLCGIGNLTWANGGSSRRSATCFGVVCVDRLVSWCFCAPSVGFRANFRAMVENTMERREIFEKATERQSSFR